MATYFVAAVAHGPRIGFAKEQCFQFGVKELWRDSKGRGFIQL